MSEIIDLDVFVGPPRQARLAGVTYKFPHDIPAETYLRILDLQARPDQLADEDVVRALRDDLLALLRIHQPDMDALPAAFSIPVLVQAIGAIYRDADEQAEAQADPTPPPASRGKSQSSRSRSRSSKSSAS